MRHIAARLPLGRTASKRHAGWCALIVAGLEMPAELWEAGVSALLYDLGWRDAVDPSIPPLGASPTLGVLSLLTGAMRDPTQTSTPHLAVAAFARSVIRG